MHRIDTPTAQKDKFGAGKNGFTRGNPQTGTPATDLDDDYFDMLQEELAGVVEAVGINLDKSKHNQLLTALKALLLSRAHPFADIKADGAAAIAEALSNLGIVAASLTTPGLVRLTSSRVSGAENIAATANAVAQNYTDIQALQGKTNDATQTNKGIIRVSDSRTSTESGVAASSLAAYQNYQDIKTTFGQTGEKGRIIGVTYTNAQAMTLYVHVSGVTSEGSVFLSANVNGVNMNGSQCANIVGQRVCISFMVPAGGTYQVGISAGTLSGQAWVETDKK
ncbi:TPA: integrase [Citrobacter freundii]|nr:integrase [Citrobacter freundii]